MPPTRPRVADALACLGIWLFAGVLDGSQAWTSFDTPDSEFHASMSAFTDQVTDRAVVPAYFWTRIGQIAPAHLFTTAFGPMRGLEGYRLLLLAVMVVALFVTLRRFADRTKATFLVLLAMSNTVLVGYLGNPYPTATVMAGLFVLIALGTARAKHPWVAPFGAGLVLGWLVMTSPFGAILGGVLFAGAVLARDGRPPRWARLGRAALAIAIGAGASFVVLLGVGRVLFPTLNWIETYTYWNSAINQADYIADRFYWLRDPSLLVPVMAIAIGTGLWLIRRGERAARLAMALPAVSAAFAVGWFFLKPSNYLEIPHYQALQWPAALTGLSLAGAVLLPSIRLTWGRGAVMGLAVGVTVGAGHWSGSLSRMSAWLVVAAAALVFLLVARLAVHDTPGARVWLSGVLALTLVFAGAQVLQNSRDTFGVSTRLLYANAFRANEAHLMAQSGFEAERWLIDRTTRDDRILTWVDAEWPPGEQVLLPLAAYQLWGPNEAAHGPVVTEGDVERWKGQLPTVIVMYGKTMGAVLDLWRTIPKFLHATPPECHEVAWTEPPSAQVCTTRLTW